MNICYFRFNISIKTYLMGFSKKRTYYQKTLAGGGGADRGSSVPPPNLPAPEGLIFIELSSLDHKCFIAECFLHEMPWVFKLSFPFLSFFFSFSPFYFYFFCRVNDISVKTDFHVDIIKCFYFLTTLGCLFTPCNTCVFRTD